MVLLPLATARVLWLGVFVGFVLVEAPGAALLPAMRGALVHWDAIAYLDITRSGYPSHLSYLDAFLPGYPLLLRGAAVLARDPVLAGWLVNLVAEAVALWYVARLVQMERDRSAAHFAVWFIALAPTAVFLTATFTESPFIAAAAASLYYARSGRPVAAAAAGGVATAFRLTGLALLPALALEQLARNRWRPKARLLWLGVIPLPLLAYCAYMQVHTGDALAIFHAERLPSFGQALATPWDGFGATWQTMTSTADGEVRSVFAREIAFGLLGLLACAGMWASSRIPRSLALYCSIAWLMTASLSFWRSEPRYILALFPAVLLVADVTARFRHARSGLLVASGVIMCAATWVYAQGRWLG
jgi:Mannosyltransferase (PIG-V)